MKTLIILFTLFSSINHYENVTHLRDLYANAATNEAKAKQLIRETENETINPLIKGYYGAGKMLMSKYYLNPFSKLNSFNTGKKILESAINTDRFNAELRYLRLTIQNNAPSFLGYRKNIEEDKKYLSGILPNIKDEHLKELIKNYLKTI